MNPINLRITFSDGTTREAVCTIADFLKFEERFDKSVSDFGKNVKLTWMVFLAWAAETRTKATSLEFEAYTETITEIEVSDAKK